VTAAPGRSEVPALQVLWPTQRAGEELHADPAEAALSELYTYPDDGCWVRANMVCTLDGAARGPDGVTASINSPTDHRVFTLLRGLADVVLVGAGTVRAEGYGPPKVRREFAAARAAEGQRPAPWLAVVTRSGELPDDKGLLTPEAGTLVITCAAAGTAVLQRLQAQVGADAVIVAGDDSVDVTAAIDGLNDRGLNRVLCEGGPTLLGQLVAAGELDELCLTWTPHLTGNVGLGLVSGTTPARDLQLGHLLTADSTLVGRWVVPR
jgi:5-amino-6-(5-phosphoribosylamino)uracil reductase